MDERQALVLAVACSLVGLVALYFFSVVLEASTQPVAINTLSTDDIGTGVKLCGIVDALKNNKGHIFFSVNDNTGFMAAVIFNSTANKLNATFANGDSLCILGQIDEYPPGSDSLEIIVKKVIL